MTHPAVAVGPTVAEHAVEELLATYGSPLYLVDAAVIRARAGLLRSSLPDKVDLAFAVKANPSSGVLATLRASGWGVDVASGGELRAVLRAGFDPDRVVFTGPGKTDAELEAALRAGVGALTIESLDELDAVLAMADLALPGQALMIRLATAGGSEGRAIIGGDAGHKFGLTDDEAGEALARLRHAAEAYPPDPFRVRGFHAFGASNVLDPGALISAAASLAHRAEVLAGRHGLDIVTVDAGGGLGIPYADAEAPLDLAALAAGLAAELATWTARQPLREARLLLEPGRWLVGPAGAYLCRVVRTKVRDGRHVAIMDGGIHHLLRPRLVGQEHRIVPVGAAAARPVDARVDVVGPLCTGLDILAAGVPLPTPRHGDVYAVLDAGAYGATESMPLFLSHPIPAEVVVDGETVTLSRARREPA
jgi:diaminopimelate decarboxylase